MRIIYCVFLLFFFSGCKVAKLAKLMSSASTSSTQFDRTIHFDYVDKHIFIDIEISGKTYNFLFDTGCEITILDNELLKEVDFKPNTKIKSSGSSFETYKMQLGFIPNLQIDNILFENVGVSIHNMDYINESYTCYKRIDGILGTNILKNAAWQIDYQNQTIRFTDNFGNLNVGAETKLVPLRPRFRSEFGLKKINVMIDDQKYDFVFDTGSYGSFTANPTLLDSFGNHKKVAIKYRDEVKGEKSYKNYVVEVDKIEFGDVELSNTEFWLEKGVSQLIGNDFLEHFLVTIDWTGNQLYLNPVNQFMTKKIGYNLRFKPNYKTNKIEVVGLIGTNEFDIELGSELISVNNVDISNLSKSEFCEFLAKTWPNVITMEEISIEVQGRPGIIKLKQYVMQ